MVRKIMMAGLMATLFNCGGGNGGAGVDRGFLKDPSSAAMNEEAPNEFKVEFTTTKGVFVLQIYREWSPLGVDRFYNLVRHGFYDQQRFFRVVTNFVVQFGISGDPSISKVWTSHPQVNPDYFQKVGIPDEPRQQSNRRATIVYAKSNQPDSRTTQVFINLRNNSNLDGMGFAPFGEVVEGMEVVESLHSEYGDAVTGKQGEITQLGNVYLDENFPGLDAVERARVVD